MARTKLHPAQVLLLSALVAAAACASTPQPGGVPPPGLVVEEVSADSVAARAGVQVGDLLLSWHRGGAGGELVTPFDLEQVRVEESPRGAVTLAGRRAEQAVSFELGDGPMGLAVTPRFGDQAVRLLAEARQAGGVEGAHRLKTLARECERPALRAWLVVRAAEMAALDAGGELWAEADASVGDDATTRAWVHVHHGRALLAANRLDEAAAAFSSALGCMLEGSLGAALSLTGLGQVAWRRGDLEVAQGYYQHALEIRERLAPGGMDVAESFTNLGVVDHSRGDLEAADRYYRRALEIQERLAPGSLEVATTLSNIGIVTWTRGDLEETERRYRRALEIRERLAPSSLDLARSLGGFGLLSWYRGDLEAAERYLRRALEVFERLAPGGLDTARTLGNIGLVAQNRGDLEAAERYFRRALGILERLTPGSLDVARSLNNLGRVAETRGDFEAAERAYRGALEIQERLAPDSLDVGLSLWSLGLLTLDRHDLEAAERYFRQALALQERLAPDSYDVAASLFNLGLVAQERADLEAAERNHRRALEIREHLGPGSLDVAESLSKLGAVARLRGDLEMAERYHRRALDILDRLAPGSAGRASSLHGLALVLRAAGRRSEAVDALRRAVQALEAQQRQLGGTPEQLGEFRAQHLEIYLELIDLLLEEGEPEEAFSVLENARARGLLALLAERDIVNRELPPELERERRITNADCDRTFAALGKLQASDEEERVRLLAALDTIRQRQDDIRSRVRAASPRLSELRYPEPLALAATRQMLDGGTVLLEYSIGTESGHLFVVGPGPDRFAVYPLPIGENALREEVTHLRRLLRPLAVSGQASRAALAEVSQSLSTTLLSPAAGAIAACTRVIVAPDGPLHVLPFSALPDPSASDGRYLVESKPISVVASATVLAQLKGHRPPPRETRLAAFGDPSYPTTTSSEASPALEQAVRSGLSLESLPATRVEVEGLGGLFGEAATLWVGPNATEERAKAVGEGVTFVHFAAHGMVDELRPLSSALALAIPEQVVEGQENGLLQAWEVFEQVRLDADLVVLSACETALGKEVAGEGILGLTRAFQYAGARSVLASLWSVADESTAELMRRFYANLKTGMPKDEALRQAQLAFIRSPVEVGEGDEGIGRDLSHPFYWAAFELVGDWR